MASRPKRQPVKPAKLADMELEPEPKPKPAKKKPKPSGLPAKRWKAKKPTVRVQPAVTRLAAKMTAASDTTTPAQSAPQPAATMPGRELTANVTTNDTTNVTTPQSSATGGSTTFALMDGIDLVKLAAYWDQRELGKNTQSSLMHLNLDGYQSVLNAVECFVNLDASELSKLKPTAAHRKFATESRTAAEIWTESRL